MRSDEMKWNWRQWDSHRQRLVTGLAMAVPLAFFLGYGPIWTWGILVMIISLVALWELESLIFQDSPASAMRALYFFPAILIPAGTLFLGAQGLLSAFALSLFCGFSGILFSSNQDKQAIQRLSLSTLAWFYIPFLMSHILLLAQEEHGREWMFFTLLVVFACDAGAYYTGRRFGRHKLYERVSPKKTVEGAVGGLCMSVAAGVFFVLLFFQDLSLWKAMLLSGIVSVVSQMGDLMESMIKRVSERKDSSTLIPGHGGILDRLDSLVFAFPVTWFFLSFWIQGI